MTLTLTYPRGNPWLPRAYIWGFIAGSWITSVSLAGQNLILSKPSLNLVYNLAIDSRFFPASSNTYSLDYVFDLSGCYATISGVPIDTGAEVLLDYDPETFSLVVRIFDGTPMLHSLTAELGHVPNYWRNV